jgi:hypothetical protein
MKKAASPFDKTASQQHLLACYLEDISLIVLEPVAVSNLAK